MEVKMAREREMAVAMAMANSVREQAAALVKEAQQQPNSCSKLACLKQALEVVVQGNPAVPELLPELSHYVLEAVLADPGWQQRRYLAEVVEQVGCKFLKQVRSMLPVLLELMEDSAPGVVVRALVTAAHLFRNTFEQMALQGIYSGQVEKWLEDVWAGMGKVKEVAVPAVMQHESDVVRLHAVKFVETMVLLFTPDPESSQPEGASRECNVAWIEGGHPVLDAVRLGQEAMRGLDLLLDQLRPPRVSGLKSTVAIVLVNSLGNIAKKRPSLLRRIVPLLVALGPNFGSVNGALVASVVRSLRMNLLALVRCTHSAAAPFRDRLVAALKEMNAGESAESAVRHVTRLLRNAEREKAAFERRALKESRSQASPSRFAPAVEVVRKRGPTQENGGKAEGADERAKRSRFLPLSLPQAAIPDPVQQPQPDSHVLAKVEVESITLSPEHQLIEMIAALVAQGDRGASAVEILIDSLPPDLLADVLIANMVRLPATPPPLLDLPATTKAADDMSPSVMEQDKCVASVEPVADVTSQTLGSFGSDNLQQQQQHAAVDSREAVDSRISINTRLAVAEESRIDPDNAGFDGAVPAVQTSSTHQAANEEAPVLIAGADGVVSSAGAEASDMRAMSSEGAVLMRERTLNLRAPILPRARFVPMRIAVDEAAPRPESKEEQGITQSHLFPSAAIPAPYYSQTSYPAEPPPPGLEDASPAISCAGFEAAQMSASCGDSQSTTPNLVLSDEQQALCKTPVERIRESYKAIAPAIDLLAGHILVSDCREDGSLDNTSLRNCFVPGAQRVPQVS